MSTSIARMVMLALAGQSLLSIPAGSIRNAGKPRRLKRIMNDTYDWFGPKGSTGNKYKPHQGKQEIARRLRGKLESKPRRMWHINTIMFGWHKSRKRSSLTRLQFHKTLGCSVVLLP